MSIYIEHMYMQGSCSGINSSALIRIDAPVATELIELMLQAWRHSPFKCARNQKILSRRRLNVLIRGFNENHVLLALHKSVRRKREE